MVVYHQHLFAVKNVHKTLHANCAERATRHFRIEEVAFDLRPGQDEVLVQVNWH